MWRAFLVLYQLWAFGQPLLAQDDVSAAAITPQNCSLDCIRQVSRDSTADLDYTTGELLAAVAASVYVCSAGTLECFTIHFV